MHTPDWFKRRRLAFKIGLSLGLLHLIFSLFVGHQVIVWSQNAQWQFYWTVPFVVDFPISAVYILAFRIPFRDFSIPFLPYPVSEVRSFIMPFLLHSVLGTIWYFCLPMLLKTIFCRILYAVRNPSEK
jgi:hypothetical protein